MAETTMNESILKALDFEPTDQREDVCESVEGCDNAAEWRIGIKTACPHDGMTAGMCDPCWQADKPKFEQYINHYGCAYCSAVALGVTAERI